MCPIYDSHTMLGGFLVAVQQRNWSHDLGNLISNLTHIDLSRSCLGLLRKARPWFSLSYIIVMIALALMNYSLYWRNAYCRYIHTTHHVPPRGLVSLGGTDRRIQLHQGWQMWKDGLPYFDKWPINHTY